MNPTGALSLQDVLIRIGFAMAAGLVLGLERESHGRAAGLKTTILACVASCIAMILSENFYRESLAMAGVMRPDRARLASGVLTGIGFLGAGAIIRQGTLVRGVTTAAVLWFITILGLAFGSGHMEIGVIGTVIAMLALFALPHVEQHIKKDFYACVTVTVSLDGITDEDIRKRLTDTGVQVQRMDLDYNLGQQTRIIQCELKLRRGDVFRLSRQIIATLTSSPGITRVKWGGALTA